MITGIEKCTMGYIMINEKFINSIEEYATELYTEDELETIEEHIRECFGEYPNVFHEVMSPDIHVDICVIPPVPGRDYYTLVTLGMGAHMMDVPDDLSTGGLERAELLITLPPDWKIVSEEEQWYWPMKLLKMAARLPLECGTWLGWGHTIDNGGPFAPGTELCGSLLVSPQCGVNELNPDAGVCRLPNGDEVNFYHLIPIYKKEMDFKRMYGAEALITYALSDVSHIVDVKRPDGCADWKESDDMTDVIKEAETMADLDELLEMAGISDIEDLENMPFNEMIIDDAAWHIDSLREKKLPVDEINAYNHLAIYMRWCMENDLMSGPFFFRHVNIVDDIKDNGAAAAVDLRAFIRDSEDIRGCMITPYFNDTGAAFTQYYYAHDENGGFPADIDSYAEEYVIKNYGRERFESGEFQDEPYLFVPYTEEYYQNMKKLMDRRFCHWLASYAGIKNSILQ